jgi:hypothetical protein
MSNYRGRGKRYYSGAKMEWVIENLTQVRGWVIKNYIP